MISTIYLALIVLLGARTYVFGNDDSSTHALVFKYLEFWSVRGGITSTGVDLLMRRGNCSCHEFQRFEFKEGTLAVVPDPICVNQPLDKFSLLVHAHFFRFFPKCQFTKEDSSFQFVVNIRDEPNQRRVDIMKLHEESGVWEAPLMSFQSTSEHTDIPIDYSRDDRKLEKFIVDIMMYENSSMLWSTTEWDSKISALFWRGSQTGGWYTVNNWKSFPRSKLVLLSKVVGIICLFFYPTTHISNHAHWS